MVSSRSSSWQSDFWSWFVEYVVFTTPCLVAMRQEPCSVTSDTTPGIFRVSSHPVSNSDTEAGRNLLSPCQRLATKPLVSDVLSDIKPYVRDVLSDIKQKKFK